MANASKRVLDIYSLSDVLEACEERAVNWNPIGLKLGLSHPQLEQIAAVTTIPKERLQRVLVAWLQKDTRPGSPDPSYHTLCHAVATGGENPALADRIAAAHSATTDDDKDIDSISSASGGYYTDEERNKLCSCGECSLQKIITEGCPDIGAKSSRRFPLLDIKRLPDGKRQQYIYMIEKEANMINTAFSDMCDDISQSMKNVDVGRLRNYCKNMRWFHEANNERSLYDRLNCCENIEDVFSVLADICSWFNHHPFKGLVDRFGSEDVKRKYAEFVNHTLMTFLKRSITEIPKDGLGEIIEGSGQFQLKIGTTAAHENIKGERLYFLKGSIADAFGISLEHLHIVSIKDGCMEVTFMIPLVIYKELFLPGLSNQYSQALQSITVSIDKYHSLIVKSVHWYDTELQCPQEKVLWVKDVATDPQELLSTEKSSGIDDNAVLPDVHTSKSQEVENLQSNSDSLQDLPSSSTEARTIAESEQASKKTLAASLRTLELFLKRAWAHHGKELRILVTGKTGQGKSTLINGILGAEVSKEGTGAARCTIDVEKISRTIVGVPVTVFDSPGLQDRSAKTKEYIRRMTEKCQQLSLVLYCTNMINQRLTDDDKNAMIKLTRAFGEKFWNYAVFVLTFANREDVSRRDGRDDPNEPEPPYKERTRWRELGKRRFQHRLKLWEEELQRFLIEEVKVSPEIAQGIPVVPTGDRIQSQNNRRPFRLPDRDNWFEEFWKVCCLRVKETCLFLQMNSNRMKSHEAKGNVDDFVAGKQDDEMSLASSEQTSSEDEQEKDLEAAEWFVKDRMRFEQPEQKQSITSPRASSFGKHNMVEETELIQSKREKPPVPPKPNRKKRSIKLSKADTAPGSVALSPSIRKSATLMQESPTLCFKGRPLEEPPTLLPISSRFDKVLPVSSTLSKSANSPSLHSKSGSPANSDSDLDSELEFSSTSSTLSDRMIEIDDKFFKDVGAETIRRNMKDAEISAAEASEALKRVSSKRFRNLMMSESKRITNNVE